MLEVNSALTWQQVQHILQQTAIRPPNPVDFVVNGAGIFHSKKAGFGFINALAAVNAAKHPTTLVNPPEYLGMFCTRLTEDAKSVTSYL